jgi:hypothetical protein
MHPILGYMRIPCTALAVPAVAITDEAQRGIGGIVKMMTRIAMIARRREMMTRR